MAVRIQHADFDVSEEIARLTDDRTDVGAVVTFSGKMRGSVDDAPLATMTLEHYPGMTEDELSRIERDAIARFNLTASLVIHRVGTLNPGDNIVLVVTCAPHRQDAFSGAAFLMDYLKTRAPFWKKETLANGESRWVDFRETDEAAAGRWQPAAVAKVD
jgi:molybdopterin synthase catalytic subunit